MLVTMQNAELVKKLVRLADGDIDLVQQAIRSVAARDKKGVADLQKVVDYIRAKRLDKVA